MPRGRSGHQIGAHGFVSRAAASTEILQAMDALARAEAFISSVAQQASDHLVCGLGFSESPPYGIVGSMTPPVTSSEYRLLVQHSPVMIWRSGLDAAVRLLQRDVARVHRSDHGAGDRRRAGARAHRRFQSLRVPNISTTFTAANPSKWSRLRRRPPRGQLGERRNHVSPGLPRQRPTAARTSDIAQRLVRVRGIDCY